MTHPLIFLHIPGVPDYVTLTVFVIVFFIVISRMMLSRMSVVPGGLQNLMEVIVSGLDGMVTDIMGEKGKPYFPLIATLGLFIFLSNLLGLIPGFMPPTANLNTTAACAIIVFVITHFIGLKEHGFHYVKHFMGPVWWLSPLIFPIEIVGHLSRPISLSMRLFGNMTGHELVVMILLFLVPIGVPVLMSIMGLLVAFIQAFVFALLSMIYLAGALEEAH
ncbi:MAG: F0F1 ATP synthase subunit A [Proteobacteria bacterium]|nr:F0F1 ATP synthase subunit A [Pseudomonadota bacterium]